MSLDKKTTMAQLDEVGEVMGRLSAAVSTEQQPECTNAELELLTWILTGDQPEQ